MAEDLPRRSHALLMRALDVGEAERAAFVAAECAGDVALRRRVTALIAALDHTRGFLETPALESSGRAPRPELPHGTIEIEGYRVVGVVGAGGMATVFEAVQLHPHRRVALKVLREGLLRTSALRRFEFEIEALARLRHPGIAQIFEAGSCGDGHGGTMPFLAMEFIPDARPITEFAAERSLSLEARLALLAAVCDAVQHGHQNGVIHRDIKPTNVLVDAGGVPKVIDFGVARSTNPEQGRLTQTADLGQLIGTLNYMSPEQCAGTQQLDVRTDVYSLGVMLYQLVCGRLPHDLSRVPVPEAVRIIRDEQPARPGAINHSLRGDIEAIVLKAIDRDPERRYLSAAGLAADIRRHLRHETIEARPPTLIYQGKMFARRHKTLVTSAAVIMATLLIATVLSVTAALRAKEESLRRQIAESGAIRQRDAALWKAYVGTIAASVPAFASGEIRLMRSRLAAAPEEHRGWEWTWLSGLAERSLDTIDAHEDMVYALCTSRDGSRLATGCIDGSVRIWDAASGRMIAGSDDLGGRANSVAFTADGEWVIVGTTDCAVQVLDSRSGSLLGTLGGHSSAIVGVACDPRGNIASASQDGEIRMWNSGGDDSLGQPMTRQPGDLRGVTFSHDGEHLATWSGPGHIWIRAGAGDSVQHRLEFPGEVVCAAFSPDGGLVVAGGGGGQLTIWNARSGELVHSLKVRNSVSDVRCLAFSPDGGVLVCGQTDRVITVWSVADGSQQTRLLGHEEAISGLTFSTDGSRLYSASWDRTIRIWQFDGEVPADLISTLRGHTDRVISTRFSPDGTMAATSSVDGTVRLWDPELGSELGVLRGHTASVYALAFSPDGRRIASGSHDSTVRWWSADTGKQEAPFPTEQEGAVWSVAFSPDGRYCASGGDDSVIRLWDTANRTVSRRLVGHTNRVTCVEFSPDGRFLASASRDHTVRLWDLTSESEPRVLSGHTSDVWSVVFSADGRVLYSGSRDQSVRIWNTADGRCEKVLDDHGQLVTSLALSPDGTRLAAGSWFGQILLWDVGTRDLVVSFLGHDTVIRSVVFSPDGRWLASASYDRTARLYDSAPQSERVRRQQVARHAYAAAEPIVERLFATHGAASGVVMAIDAGEPMEAQVRPYVRKLVLERGLERSKGVGTASNKGIP